METVSKYSVFFHLENKTVESRRNRSHSPKQITCLNNSRRQMNWHGPNSGQMFPPQKLCFLDSTQGDWVCFYLALPCRAPWLWRTKSVCRQTDDTRASSTPEDRKQGTKMGIWMWTGSSGSFHLIATAEVLTTRELWLRGCRAGDYKWTKQKTAQDMGREKLLRGSPIWLSLAIWGLALKATIVKTKVSKT